MDQELKLLNIIVEQEKINQRTIAKEVGVSLGTINSMLRQMEAEEYIYIRKAANNSAQYMLTEQGRSYRSQKLLEYIVECSEVITKTRLNMRNLLISLASQGIENFYLSEKEDEIHRMLMLILMEISRKFKISYQQEVPENLPENSIILGWNKENPYYRNKKYIHIVHKI